MRLPCPADLLLMAIDHTLLHGSSRRIDWICDAYMLVKNFDDKDWTALIEIAARNHLIWTSLVVLNYIQESFGCLIPPLVQQGLVLAAGKNRNLCDDLAKFCARSAARSSISKAFCYAPSIQQRLWVLTEAVRMPLGRLRRALCR